MQLRFLSRFHHCKPRNHFFSLKPSSNMEISSPTSSQSVLILSGKSSLETQHAQLIKKNGTLKLPEDDTGVSVFARSSEGSLETFDVGLYMSLVSTEKFGRFLMWSPRLSSTQDLVSRNFCELPIGAVCVADIQFKGRGRSKNVWESPIGCLLFSFTLQMEDGRIVPLLQYVVSLAVTEAIKDVCYANGLPYLDIRIKWPNDLFLNGLKVGGILCTSTYRSKTFNVTIGIGLNVDNEKPTTSLNVVLQDLTSVAYKLRREEILAAFFKRFENFFNVFLTQGFQALEGPYCKTWLHSGQKVVIKEEIEGQLEKEVAVTIQGLTSSGYLLAIGEDNQLYELHPDGNSLDFFKGLIRRKL
ncbi:hypothetical protein GIB67_002797 [Kingdonia uniflora]|uniref:BPL/LPL catalytic domain-containing protein n=1 Tax=Kingdonia uniflora TaxID=39325 RepID=A0A7J7N1C7_9MAGN|nr:hypothetical protein GIB67_002797 [Kingdonia uniflora]